MPAIVTNQFRTNLAKSFLADVIAENYYTWIGFSNPTNSAEGGTSDWNDNTPAPIDNFNEFNRYFDTIMTYLKISSSDIAPVVPNIRWTANTAYDMYRNNYSRYNLTPVTQRTSLYDSNYYVINRDYRVYICLNNGAGWDFSSGSYVTYKNSQIEPLFTSVLPQTLADGYVWQYLYTLTPNTLINFYNNDYIPIPRDWGTPEQSQDVNVFEAAVNGAIPQIILNNPGSGYPVSSTFLVPIRGDGSGGVAQIQTNSSGQVSGAIVSVPGQNYTVAYIDLSLESTIPHTGTSFADFEVTISPKGGLGYDLIEDLGGFRIMIASTYESDANNPDLPVENSFARIGVIKNPTTFGSQTNLYTASVGSGLFGAKLAGFTTETIYDLNTPIYETISAGTTAVGSVVSWDSEAGILRYSQPVGLSTSISNYNVNRFSSTVGVGGSIAIFGQISGNALNIDTTFNGSTLSLNNQIIDLGVNYTNGLANPDVNLYQGEIIYVDNRPSLSLNPNQTEDIKIIIEF